MLFIVNDLFRSSQSLLYELFLNMGMPDGPGNPSKCFSFVLQVDKHESARAMKKAELLENLKRLFPGVVCAVYLCFQILFEWMCIEHVFCFHAPYYLQHVWKVPVTCVISCVSSSMADLLTCASPATSGIRWPLPRYWVNTWMPLCVTQKKLLRIASNTWRSSA